MLTVVTFDNLVSGLLGAMIGVAGAVLLDWRARRGDVRAAARAAYMEVAANGAALNMAVKHGVYVPVVSTTWAASHHLLSRGLSPAELVVVATFYMHVDSMIGGGFTAGHPDPRLAVVAGEIFERSAMAAAVLERRGWSPRQREELQDALKGLAPKA